MPFRLSPIELILILLLLILLLFVFSVPLLCWVIYRIGKWVNRD